MKTVFLGTPELAVPSLRLLADRSTVGCVITQPDRPAGRGKRLRPAAVKVAAQDLGLPVWQPECLRGLDQDPRLDDCDLFVVMAYGEILDAAWLARPRACINLHASLLPAWRGASPLQAAIRAGDRLGGISVMRMVRRLDAGPVYLRQAVAMAERITLGEWHDRQAELAAVALGRFLDAWPDCRAEEQDPGGVSYCHKLTTADGHIDFTQDSQAVDRQVRAYTPIPGCWALGDGQRLRIQSVAPRPDHRDLSPGMVLRNGDTVLVGCGSGAIQIRRLQAPGSRAMDIRDYLNGHPLPRQLS